MENKERKSMLEYGIELFMWGFFVANMYKQIAFRLLPGMTLVGSRRVYWILWALLIITCFILTPPKKRNALTVFVTVNLSPAIYFFITYRDLYPRLISVAGLLAAGIAILYAGVVLAGYVCARRSGRAPVPGRRFLPTFFHRVKMLSGSVLSLLFFIFLTLMAFGSPLLKPDVSAADPRIVPHRIADNIDTILLLQDDQWAALTPRERLNVMQTVANIEASYLGLPHELNVTLETLDPDILAAYTDTRHAITINADYFLEVPPRQLVHAIAHEAFHAYEHRLVDLFESTDPEAQNLMIFNRVRTYQEEFLDYVQPEESFYLYDRQAVESDSDAYGNSAVEDYYEAIREHLNPDAEP